MTANLQSGIWCACKLLPARTRNLSQQMLLRVYRKLWKTSSPMTEWPGGTFKCNQLIGRQARHAAILRPVNMSGIRLAWWDSTLQAGMHIFKAPKATENIASCGVWSRLHHRHITTTALIPYVMNSTHHFLLRRLLQLLLPKIILTFWTIYRRYPAGRQHLQLQKCIEFGIKCCLRLGSCFCKSVWISSYVWSSRYVMGWMLRCCFTTCCCITVVVHKLRVILVPQQPMVTDKLTFNGLEIVSAPGAARW